MNGPKYFMGVFCEFQSVVDNDGNEHHDQLLLNGQPKSIRSIVWLKGIHNDNQCDFIRSHAQKEVLKICRDNSIMVPLDPLNSLLDRVSPLPYCEYPIHVGYSSKGLPFYGYWLKYWVKWMCFSDTSEGFPQGEMCNAIAEYEKLENITQTSRPPLDLTTMSVAGHCLLATQEIVLATKTYLKVHQEPESISVPSKHDETAVDPPVSHTETPASIDLDALRQSLPPVPQGRKSDNGWVHVSNFSRMLDKNSGTLRNERCQGEKTSDGLFGVSVRNHIWSKRSQNTQAFYRHPEEPNSSIAQVEP